MSEATPDQIAEKVRARDEETSRGRRPAYLLLVVGLATLVGGLIVSGRLRPTYTAQARVAVRDADSTPEILDRLKRDLASEQNIERTVRDGLGSVRKMVFPHERDARAAFAQAASEIEITRLSGSGRDGLVASVELREDDPWESALILNALVRQLLADRATGDNGASADALAQAANATDRARRQLAEAQARLDGQLQWHVEQSRAQAEKSAASQVADESAAVDPAAKQRQELTRQLGRLRDERYALLSKVTERHPAVQNLDAQMSQIEAELVALPPPPTPAEISEQVPDRVAAQSERDAAVSQEQLTQLEARRSELAEATAHVRACEQAEADLRAETVASDGRWFEVLEWADPELEPNEPLRKWGHWFAMATALCLGTAVSLTARSLPVRLFSLESLRSATELPIVATISPTGPVGDERRIVSSREAARRRIVDVAWRASELLLASVVAVVGILIATVPSFTTALRTEPLRGLGTVVDYVVRSLPF